MPTPTSPLYKSVSPSSRKWLTSHFRDPYVKARLSHPAQFRSRSAFKLIELHEKYGSFLTRGVNTVVDLGAAPGGWSQVVARKMGWTEEAEAESLVGNGIAGRWKMKGRLDLHAGLGRSDRDKNLTSGGSWSGSESIEDKEGENRRSPYDLLYANDDNQGKPLVGRGTVVAVDLLHIPPISGVRTLQIDFLSPQAQDLIHAMLVSPSNPEGKADLILSDMAANFTGNKVRDTEASLDICIAVYNFVKKHLRTVNETGKTYSGTLLLKHFSHPLLKQFRIEHLTPNFHHVIFCKPDSSRKESAEGYWICRGWKGVPS